MEFPQSLLPSWVEWVGMVLWLSAMAFLLVLVAALCYGKHPPGK